MHKIQTMSNEVEEISRNEAIRRMRLVSKTKDGYFAMMHLTCNLKTGESGELRKVERARLREALRRETFQVDGDHYLPYTDLDINEPRMCFKVLIRWVGFPPDYRMMKVKLFD